MSITPFTIWRILFLGSVFSLFLFPPWKILFCALTVLHITVFSFGMKSWWMQFFGKVFYRRSSVTMNIAVTFDDGPDPAITNDILDILKTWNMTATFFVIGIKAKRYPEIVKRCFNEGHCIACHDLTHSNYANFRFTKSMTHEIAQTQEIIKSIIGKKPRLYRPPVGLLNPHTLKVMKKLGMYCIGWTKSAGEAGNQRKTRISRISTLAKRGEVVLLHDVLPKPALKQEILLQLNQFCANIKQKELFPVDIATFFSLPAYED